MEAFAPVFAYMAAALGACALLVTLAKLIRGMGD